MRDHRFVPTPNQPSVGSVVSGFRIESLVGRGGMGVVYRATQLSLERPVALKLISPELASEERFRERFLHEARLAASIDHPHLLPVYEAGEAEGTLFLALRLVEGESLAGLLRREGALSPERALRLHAQLASALQAAHDAGLLHRDVKPHNVLLAGEGEAEHAYLCDFGLARRLGGSLLTDERTFVGTAAYAAPEQIRGQALDARCDLYSLSCVLYECLTGRPPFYAEDELALCWAHLHEPAPLPGETDPALASFDSFFARALAKDPEERFFSAAELAQAAEAAFAGAAPGAESAEAALAHRLPRAATSFLGREYELQEVLELLLDENVRLLTLTGPGGTGKTRLALRAAEEAAPAFAEGVYWVGLASLRDPSLVTETIAQTLEANQELAAHIGEQRLLVLLDNLEQVVEAAPELASLLQTCPNLNLLVTSRELLRVRAEVEYPVPPLADSEGVELFCRRSRLDPSAEVAELCGRLDNLPLAVELAAARTKALSPAQILERLASRLDLLTGARDLDPRQQTLRATIDWSYELLSEGERRLFARLAVFAGGCTLEAAEEVAGADLDTLQSLVEKSLLRFSNERYWMLETIREYAAERLDASEGTAEMARHHAAYLVELADRGYTDLRGRDAALWLQRFEDDHDNFRAALGYLLEREPAGALRLVGALSRFWMTRGYLSEGRRWLETTLDTTRERAGRPRALRGLALIEMEQGDLDRAAAVLEEAHQLDRESGDEEGAALAMGLLADISAHQGDLDRAASLWEECVELWRSLGRRLELAIDLYSLAFVARLRGELASTETYLEESHAIFCELEDVRGQAGTLAGLAQVAVDRGDLQRAHSMLISATELYSSIRFVAGLLDSLELHAMVLEGQGESEAAARLWGARYALGGELGRESDHPLERAQHDDAVARARSALSDEMFEHAWELGTAMTLEAVTEYALSFSS